MLCEEGSNELQQQRYAFIQITCFAGLEKLEGLFEFHSVGVTSTVVVT